MGSSAVRSSTEAVAYAVVVPTIGRPCLQACLDALATARGPLPSQVILADDRRDARNPLPVKIPAALVSRTTTVSPRRHGPAAARNAGWRAADRAEWIVFLDDDVQVGSEWAGQLAADLAAQNRDVAGVQGIIEVPRPTGRRPTEWERDTIALETSWWITADIAYRREALECTGGFDERYGTFREDSDLALRLLDRGWNLGRGSRRTTHPIRAAGQWPSLRAQARHSGDAAMTAMHGHGWRRRSGETLGPRRAYVAICALGVTSLILFAVGRRRDGAMAAAGWLVLTAGLTGARTLPGPRTLADIVEMTVTSVAVPPLAAGWWLLGRWRWRHRSAWKPDGRAAPLPLGAASVQVDGQRHHDGNEAA